MTIAPEAVPGSALGPADDRPLNEQEYQLLQRLLSDPFSFPAPFKAWLISYLETSDMNLPISAINGLAGILGIAGIGGGGGALSILPAGIILPFGGAAAPNGSKLCDGAAYNTTTEARLFAAIGYRYGGAGASFSVPDYRGRSPVGVGTHADVNALGKSDGLPASSRTPRHSHTVSVSDPTHNHGVSDPGHSHGASDSGHSHGYRRHTEGGINIQQGTAGAFANVGTTDGFDTNTSNGNANISIGGSGTGIGIGASGTGIGVSISGGGGGTDMAAFETCNFIIIS